MGTKNVINVGSFEYNEYYGAVLKDPTIVPCNASYGAIVILAPVSETGVPLGPPKVFQKLDNGLSTNWQLVGSDNDFDYKNPVQAASLVDVNIAVAPANLDGVVGVIGDRWLLKNQSLGQENGIYIFNGVGIPLTRSLDADTNAEVTQGLFTWVLDAGGTQARTGWLLNTPNPIVLGVTVLNFVEIPVVPASDVLYTPSVPADWKLPLPLNTQEALDQAAAFINQQSDNYIYVDAIAGSDTDGTGSILRPLQSLQAAMSYVTSAPQGNYTINLSAGDYGGAPVVIPSQLNKRISIQGSGASTNISALVSYTSTGPASDELVLIQNLGISTPFDIDLGLSTQPVFILLDSGSFTPNRIDTLPPGPQFVKVTNSFIPYFQSNSIIQFDSCNFVGGPPSVVSATATVFMTSTVFSYMVATVDGYLGLIGCLTDGTSLSGLGTLGADATSFKNIISTLPGKVYLDTAPELGYTPTNPTNYLAGTDTVQKALDNSADFINSKPIQQFYISPNGSDTDGTGNINRPYASIQHTLSIIALSPGLRYEIIAAPGTYGGAPIVWPELVNLTGDPFGTKISASVSFTAQAPGFERIYFSGVQFNGGFTFDGNLGAPNGGIINFVSCTVNNLVRLDSNAACTLNFYNESGIDGANITGSILLHDSQITGTIIVQANGTLALRDSILIGGATTLASPGLLPGLGNLALYNSIVIGTVTGDGASIVSSDSPSMKISSLFGSTFPLCIIESLDDAPYLRYAPTTPADWAVVPTTVQEGLDELAASNAASDPITFVYQPGGIPGGHIYDVWADLYAAAIASSGPITIFFDDSIVTPAVIPAGAYPFAANVTFDTMIFGDPSAIEVAAGVTWTNVRVVKNLNINFLNTAVVETLSNAAIRLEGAEITAGGLSAIWTTSTFGLIQITQGSSIIGTGAVPVLSVSGGGSAALGVTNNIPGNTNANAIAGGIGDILQIFYGDSSGFTPILAQVNFLGTVTSILATTAFLEGYVPTTPADWLVAPINVGEALNELASRVNALSGTFKAEMRTITAPEALAKQLTLAQTPLVPGEVCLAYMGVTQFYNDDYTVAAAILDWTGLGLDAFPVVAGDKMVIWYKH